MANFRNINRAADEVVVKGLQEVSKRYNLPDSMLLYLEFFSLHENAKLWLDIIARYFDEEYTDGIKLTFDFGNTTNTTKGSETIDDPRVISGDFILIAPEPRYYGQEKEKYQESLLMWERSREISSTKENRIKTITERIRLDSDLLRTFCPITVTANVYRVKSL